MMGYDETLARRQEALYLPYEEFKAGKLASSIFIMVNFQKALGKWDFEDLLTRIVVKLDDKYFKDYEGKENLLAGAILIKFFESHKESSVLNQII